MIDPAVLELKLSIGDCMRAARTELGLSQAKMGRLIDVDQAVISKIERAHPVVSLERAFTVLLKVVPGGLTGRIGGPGPSFIMPV